MINNFTLREQLQQLTDTQPVTFIGDLDYWMQEAEAGNLDNIQPQGEKPPPDAQNKPKRATKRKRRRFPRKRKPEYTTASLTPQLSTNEQ